MRINRNHAPKALLLALEADAASARGGFACLFSTSDEYEAALITERRAQGRVVPAVRTGVGVDSLGIIVDGRRVTRAHVGR